MHVGNRNWLDDLQARFVEQITGSALLEIGSLNMNGSARECLRTLGRRGSSPEL